MYLLQAIADIRGTSKWIPSKAAINVHVERVERQEHSISVPITMNME